jgi:hypothetical protein
MRRTARIFPSFLFRIHHDDASLRAWPDRNWLVNDDAGPRSSYSPIRSSHMIGLRIFVHAK